MNSRAFFLSRAGGAKSAARVLCVPASLRQNFSYQRNPPIGGKQQIINALNARGIRYGIAEYRDAYVVAFLTNEKILMASNRVRIRSYEREVRAHRQEAVRIERRPCAGGEQVLPRLYFCPP